MDSFKKVQQKALNENKNRYKKEREPEIVDLGEVGEITPTKKTDTEKVNY